MGERDASAHGWGRAPDDAHLAACAGAPPSPQPTGAGSASAGPGAAAPNPIAAADAEGRFRLDFALPKATWTEAEAIEGLATLNLLGPGALTLGTSGDTPLTFGFRELTGRREIGPASRASCGSFDIGEGAPVTSTIIKSGGWDGADANAALYKAFFQDEQVHLPPGTWEITAYAAFTGAGCEGSGTHDLRAPSRIEVVPAP